MKNIGTPDRLIRVLLAEVCIITGYFWTGGEWSLFLYLVATMILVQAATGVCGLYGLLGINTYKGTRRSQKRMIRTALALILVLGVAASYGSALLTENMFTDDFNAVDEAYRLTLQKTGSGDREGAVEEYQRLKAAFQAFKDRYEDYRPLAVRSDGQLSGDLDKAGFIITNVKGDIYEGNHSMAHSGLEQLGPLLQGILDRNGLSTPAVNP